MPGLSHRVANNAHKGGEQQRKLAPKITIGHLGFPKIANEAAEYGSYERRQSQTGSKMLKENGHLGV
ncbi:hypothetical protein [Delftia tsuruhatensis]|uniref:hypothetical protein n=1 Tax=Delftia tsuruhatensis TaxID=180282 RepID=UPI002090D9C4|nr:hypothetical protein [Delftia tsuruhatensis]MCO5337590.1 hypothetical protein [Delftia tsuruhatensis]MCR4545125.1 hypothetical protein [Delftia tsuruhatensis]